MCEIKKYHDSIREYAKENSTEFFKNADAQHASCLMAAIFDHSTKVKMFSNFFSPEVTARKDFTEALVKFLEDNQKQLEVIFQKIPEGDNNAYKVLNNAIAIKKNVKIRLVDPKSPVLKKIKEKNNGVVYNFCTGDNKIFRLEHVAEDYQAVASFNQPGIVNNLNEVYKMLLQDSGEIQ